MINKYPELGLVIGLLLVIILLFCAGAFDSHAYEIKDTVCVEDSITVTMSMEEWEEYLYWFAPDSGSVSDGYRLITSQYDALDTLWNRNITCRIYGFLYNISGYPETDATVTAVIQGSNNLAVTSNTDITGYFSLDLIPGSEYEITIACREGSILHEQVIIPDLTSWQLVW